MFFTNNEIFFLCVIAMILIWDTIRNVLKTINNSIIAKAYRNGLENSLNLEIDNVIKKNKNEEG